MTTEHGYYSTFAADSGDYHGDGSDLQFGSMIGDDMVITFRHNYYYTWVYVIRPDGSTYDLTFKHRHEDEPLPFSDEREITS